MKFTIGLLLFILNIVLRVWCLSLYWDWFFADLIPIEKPTLPHLYGLALTASLLTADIDTKREERTLVERFLFGTFAILIFVLAGWIVTLFM